MANLDEEFDKMPEVTGEVAPLKVDKSSHAMPQIHVNKPSVTDEGESIKQPESPGLDESYAYGYGNAGSLGFGDEGTGVIAAGQEALSRVPGLGGLADRNAVEQAGEEDLGKKPLLQAMLDKYRSKRDEARRFDLEAEKAHPGAYVTGSLAGATAIPMAGAVKGLGKVAQAALRVLQAGGIGGLAGLGMSKADLTQGQASEALRDTAKGAGYGIGAGALGEAVGALGGQFGNRAAKATEDATNKAVAAREAERAALAGAKGSAVQNASRDLEVMSREAAELPPGPTKDKLIAFLKSPEAIPLREKVALGKLSSAPNRVQEVEKASQALEDFVAQSPQAVKEAVAKATSPQEALRKIMSFATTYGNRAAQFALGATAGHHVGGLAGMAIGGLGGAAMGHVGTALKNRLNDPAVRSLASKAISATLNNAGGAISQLGSVGAGATPNDLADAIDSMSEPKQKEILQRMQDELFEQQANRR